MFKKKLMIVDDSALMRRIESDIINSDSRFEVVKTCDNGLDAFNLVRSNPSSYDAILLDINLPKMSGIEFLEAVRKAGIKANVIIISSSLSSDSEHTIVALELGAIDFISKPENLFDFKSDGFKNRLLEKLAIASGIHHLGFEAEPQTIPLSQERSQPKEIPSENRFNSIRPAESASASSGIRPGHIVSPMNVREILANVTGRTKKFVPMGDNAKKLVLIASSTGGPKALQEVIPYIPANINAPVIVVQHMSAGFTKPLAERLDNSSRLKVKEAMDGEIIKKGNVYIAQGGTQLRLKKVPGGYAFDVNTAEPPRAALKPCADILFESVVGTDFDEIICCVLTGMGGDGTMGIQYLTQKNNCFVIAQDEKTSTVYGMPKVVIDAGLTDIVVPLEDVAHEITKNTGVK